MLNWQLPPYWIEDQTVGPLSQVVDWGVTMLGIPDLWKKTKGEGIKVGLLDTGSGKQHPDLAEAIVGEADFTGSRYGPADINGHGTHCAGIIGARDNEVATVGVAPKSDIYVAKVLGDNGSGSGQGIAAGGDWLISKGVNVLSMSLGSPQPDPSILAMIKRACAQNIVVVVAAGNSGPNPNTVDYPGKWSLDPTLRVITVAAINQQKVVSRFSSRGPEVTVAAPGEKILSTWLNAGTATLSGTSMATPFVSGTVALMLAFGIKPENVIAEIKRTAIDIDQLGTDPNAGAGI